MVAFTEKYSEFNGRIITEEEICFDDDKVIRVNAQWDCGATYSSISKELALELGLKSIDTKNMDSTSDTMQCNIYDIGVVLRGSDIVVSIEASESPNIHKTGNIDLLIGMDIISKGDFAISTYNGITYFSFRYPSQKLIDFTK